MNRFLGYPNFYDYRDFISANHVEIEANYDFYPCVRPNWDNTPRSGAKGTVIFNSTPELFRQQRIIPVANHHHMSPRGPALAKTLAGEARAQATVGDAPSVRAGPDLTLRA